MAGTLSPIIGGILLLSGIDYTAKQIAEMPEADKLLSSTMKQAL